MDVIVINGRVETMDPRNPIVEAVGIRDGVIVALGSNAEVIADKPAGLKTVDAAGRTVVPGFIEPHNHMLMYGLSLLSVDARTPPNRSVDDIVDRLRERAHSTPAGGWVRGGRYDDTDVVEMRHPNHHDLDRASTEHPIVVTHNSGHMMAVNSKALEVGSIDSDTADPAGGRIGRFPGTSDPDGMLYETAQSLVSQHIPEYTPQETRNAFLSAQEEYLRRGVTTTHDIYVGESILKTYQDAYQDGAFKLRVNMFLGWELLKNTGFDQRTGDGDEWLRVAGCKIISDGLIQGITAALRQPYYCNENEQGWLIYEQDELNEMVMALHERDYQIATHANGDDAIDAVLNAYENALSARPKADHRFRIEHCQICHLEHIERIARLGVIPDFFVNHVYYWGDGHRDRFLGPDRALHLDPVGSALRAGLRPLLHSDCPVTPINPLFCVQSAVARITSSGKVLNPAERVSVREGLAAMTTNSAFGAFEERNKGSLEIGKLRDLVILEQCPFEVAPEEIGGIEVAATVVGGEIMHHTDEISIG